MRKKRTEEAGRAEEAAEGPRKATRPEIRTRGSWTPSEGLPTRSTYNLKQLRQMETAGEAADTIHPQERRRSTGEF